PTLDTILERINTLGIRMDQHFEALSERLEQIDTRLDRTQSMAHDMRGDFRELRAQLSEHLPELE
ncbi:MAG: hypothetical protein ACRD68_19160, partial [Pyrinomonadaceae bacterium]